MRKSLMVLLTMLLLLAVTASAQTEIPAPFAKAKEIALSAGETFPGRFVLNMECNENGEVTIFVLGYLANLHLIGIGTLEPDYVVFEYNEETGGFSVYLGGMGRIPAKDADCIEAGFKIFRELVKKKLI